MALWPVQTVQNCIPYTPWAGEEYNFMYNLYLIQPPRTFQESVAYMKGFFYEPSNDYLVAYAMLNTVRWPGWAVDCFYWDAGTGTYVGRVGAGGSFSFSWANHPASGDLNKVYTTMNSGPQIYEVPWNSLSPAAGGWSANPSTWTPSRLFSHAVVNRGDGLLCGVSGVALEVWDLNSGPSLRTSLRLPEGLGYLAYEDRDRVWMVTSSGLVAKADYKLGRWEALTSIQNPSSDATGYFCAFDTKRKRFVVLRQRPDAADGSCQCQLEFYRPLIMSTMLTDPVPVTPLRQGENVQFVSHLVGAVGEGVVGYLANAFLMDPPTGQCLTPQVRSELGGKITVQYRSAGQGQDILALSANITEVEA